MIRNYLTSIFAIYASVSFLHADTPCDYLKAYFLNANLVIDQLNGGLSGASNYKVTSGNHEYVLRILAGNTSFNDRQREIKAAILGGKLGIAPAIYYVSPNEDAFIMDYIQGSTLSLNAIQNKETLTAILKVIRTLHSTKDEFPQGVTVFEVIRSKFKKFPQDKSPISTSTLNMALKKLEILEKRFKNASLVPSHNDLNALNIISSAQGIKLIDWTEAGMNYAYIDLGYFALTNRIKENQYSELLSLYLGHCPSENDIRLLKDGKEVALLRLFATIFFDLEKPISDEKAKIC
jgi:thiamine kinase-like enzyme